MAHMMGNSTHCIDCKFFRENTEEDKSNRDGWCMRGQKINGKKINDKTSVYWNNGTGCQDWTDEMTGITHFEAMTRQPEAWRTDAEKEYLMKLLRGDENV